MAYLDGRRLAPAGFSLQVPPHPSQGEDSHDKKEMAKAIADELGISVELTKEVIQKTFAAIIETLETEGRIELRNFGVFEVKKRKARKARNPRTGEVVQVPPKIRVTFKAGKEMVARTGQQETERPALVGTE